MTGPEPAAILARSMGRKIDDERDARACLRAARAAGVRVGAWARENGIDGRSLDAWQINLSRSRTREDAASNPRLVELVPAAPPRVDARYVVRVAVTEVELADDFREETLVRLVRALRAC